MAAGFSIQPHALSLCSNPASNFDSNGALCLFAFDPVFPHHACFKLNCRGPGERMYSFKSQRLQWRFKCTLEKWLKCARVLIWIQWTVLRASLCLEFNTPLCQTRSWNHLGKQNAELFQKMLQNEQLTGHWTSVWASPTPLSCSWCCIFVFFQLRRAKEHNQWLDYWVGIC